MLRLTLDKSPAVKLDAKLYSADDNVKLNSTRMGKRSKVGIFEVSEGGGVCFFLGILFQFGVDDEWKKRIANANANASASASANPSASANAVAIALVGII